MSEIKLVIKNNATIHDNDNVKNIMATSLGQNDNNISIYTRHEKMEVHQLINYKSPYIKVLYENNEGQKVKIF